MLALIVIPAAAFAQTVGSDGTIIDAPAASDPAAQQGATAAAPPSTQPPLSAPAAGGKEDVRVENDNRRHGYSSCNKRSTNSSR